MAYTGKELGKWEAIQKEINSNKVNIDKKVFVKTAEEKVQLSIEKSKWNDWMREGNPTFKKKSYKYQTLKV